MKTTGIAETAGTVETTGTAKPTGTTEKSGQGGDRHKQPVSMTLRRHMRVGKYRLDKRLGLGGCCEVWKARDCVEGIWVALKIPHADVHGQRDNQTILREVRLVAKLRHPNILPLKNAEIIDGHAVLATELSVKTLDDCTRPMSPRRIISIIRDVLQGLAHAHQGRVVHCDVTPGNIFLLESRRAAVGDFGIGLLVSGRMATFDKYGTPGYVSPEQAFGKPTYRSDCFSVAVVLYEFLTGHLHRWPFKWPPRGCDKLRHLTSTDFVKFMKKALLADPTKRFANADRMLAAFHDAVPRNLLSKQPGTTLAPCQKLNWKQLRTQTFVKRYKRLFPGLHSCTRCSQPIDETMLICPWCGSDKNRYDERTRFTHLCRRCHRGVSPQWNYCPWCYGPGFVPQQDEIVGPITYHDNCKHCRGKVARFMRYCPWCKRKVTKRWQPRPFPETCTSCGWGVDSSFWKWCPWCKQMLV